MTRPGNCVTGCTGALAAAKRASQIIRWDFAAVNGEVVSRRNRTGCSQNAT